MQNTLRAALLCAFTLTGSLACSESVSPPVGSSEAQESAGPSHAIFAYGRADLRTPLRHDEDADELQTEYARLRAATMEIVTAREPLDIRSRKLRAFLTANDGFALSHYLNQFAAISVLREALRQPGDTHLETIDYFTNLLVETGSPEAPLVSESLVRLKGRWSDDRIRHAAGVTVERALWWVEKVCTSCLPTGKLPYAGQWSMLTDLDAKRRRVIEATVDLRKIAGP